MRREHLLPTLVRIGVLLGTIACVAAGVLAGSRAEGAPPQAPVPPQCTLPAHGAIVHAPCQGDTRVKDGYLWTWEEDGQYWWRYKEPSVVIPYDPGLPPVNYAPPRAFRPFFGGGGSCGGAGGG